MNPFDDAFPQSAAPRDPRAPEQPPKLSCMLPHDAVVAERGAAILETFGKIGELLDQMEYSDSPAYDTLAGISNQLATQQSRSGTSSLMDLDMVELQTMLEYLAGELPEDTPRPLQAAFAELLNVVSGYNELVVSKVIRISISGAPAAVEEATEAVTDELSQVIDEFRQSLAKKYNWSRGQTTCCSEMGFNPPDGKGLEPVHDPKGFESQSARVIILSRSEFDELFGRES